MLAYTALFLISLVSGVHSQFVAIVNENLLAPLLPADIVIYSGSTTENRENGFRALTSNQLKALAVHNGYRLAFFDELGVDQELRFNGTHFSGQWTKLFAIPALQLKYPHARYFSWIDETILVPNTTTTMLNHYINTLERNLDAQILIGDGSAFGQLLDTGMLIVKNGPFVDWLVQEALLLGLERNGHLAKGGVHEEEALDILYHRHQLGKEIVIEKHRDGAFNFNTILNWSQEPPRAGDVFVRFANMREDQRLHEMMTWMQSSV